METDYLPGKQEKSPVKKFFSVAFDFLKIIVIAALIVLPIRYFLFQPFIVKGESMAPNFHSSDYLIIDEISYKFRDPKRGEVVVIRFPLDESQRFIKRIIGLPGETIRIKEGKVIVLKGENPLALDEQNYLSSSLATSGDIEVVLREQEYFVLGDNRNFSYDSRGWGPVLREDIIGKAIFRLFPVADINYIPTPAY